jgi:hypothetical protein
MFCLLPGDWRLAARQPRSYIRPPTGAAPILDTDETRRLAVALLEDRRLHQHR